MSSSFGEQIDLRAKAILGPGWETGGVQEIDENSFLTPRPEGDDRVLLTILWPTDEEAAVANGLADVIGSGGVDHRDLPTRVGRLDDVVAHIAQETPRLLAMGPRRWWGR
ncbi:hypothetical protein [Cellulomonas soli]